MRTKFIRVNDGTIKKVRRILPDLRDRDRFDVLFKTSLVNLESKIRGESYEFDKIYYDKKKKKR